MIGVATAADLGRDGSLGLEGTGAGSPTGDKSSQERIRGGEASRAYLRAQNLRDDYNGSEPALRVIQACFPGFGWERVNNWDPGGTREMPDGRRRNFAARVVSDDEITNGEHGEPLGPSGRQVRSFVRYTGYPREFAGRCDTWPTLADLVRHARGELELNITQWGMKIESSMGLVLKLGGDGSAFTAMLLTQHGDRSLFHLPHETDVVQAVADWLYQARETGEATVACAVCPDWATAKGAKGIERYTFNELGDGIGLVARRAIPGLMALERFAAARGITLNFLVVIGDFEGLNDDTLRRIGISFEEFQQRCRRSQVALGEELVHAMPSLEGRIDLQLATELAGGTEAWISLVDRHREIVRKRGLAGALGLTSTEVRQIAGARRSLFQRWHGDDVKVFEELERQLPEYGAMVDLCVAWSHRQSPNDPLIVGADAVANRAAFQLGQEEPRAVVHLRNHNY